MYSGVQILEQTTVQQVVVEKGHVTAVETDRGSIECEYFVNCAGQVKYFLKLFSCPSFCAISPLPSPISNFMLDMHQLLFASVWAPVGV